MSRAIDWGIKMWTWLNFNGIFHWFSGKTYFFKGKVFWEFNDRKMSVVSRTPSLSAPFWMSCPTGMDTLEPIPGEERLDPPKEDPLRSLSSSAPLIRTTPILLLICFLLARNSPAWKTDFYGWTSTFSNLWRHTVHSIGSCSNYVHLF